ncbi:protein MIZU-KUSSEI 1 [Solanum pennellii]|uniref:Protein MIZU-KUSSEI 1 n=1 Tax=Solanum pennellii TaxID=28526 RepID=A0ABM1V057_SOLPN|nr:protein MIZU-KUSSEI 1 [Solanum pennellii]
MAFRFKNQNPKPSSIYSSSPFNQIETPPLLSLLQRTTNHSTTTTTAINPSNTNPKKSRKSSTSTSGGILKMFKLLPMLTTGCKMVALLGGRPRNKPMLTDKATTITLFGYKKGRVSLAIQEDPHRPPIFVIELPMLTGVFHKEMGSDIVRLALESETKTQKKKVLEEFVWGVYCNGRKFGYSIRRNNKNMSDDEAHVMQLLRGVSMGAGVLPCPILLHDNNNNNNVDGEITYMRARFDRVVGSKDSEAFYMINPDGASSQELSIFFVRLH